MDLELPSRVLGIILIDLVLSGDNAVVMGMAARRLRPEQRSRVIMFGGGAAIALRIVLTAVATLLLQVPLLQLLGGLLLVWIVFKLLRSEAGEEHVRAEGAGLGQQARPGATEHEGGPRRCILPPPLLQP